MNARDPAHAVQSAHDDPPLKIKMKNGRTLTTLIKEGGKSVADTIWFK